MTRDGRAPAPRVSQSVSQSPSGSGGGRRSPDVTAVDLKCQLNDNVSGADGRVTRRYGLGGQFGSLYG